MGTTAQSHRHPLHRTVHPHARGDNLRRPHVFDDDRVHPHARGDNMKWSLKRRDGYGSPPRAWGQLVSQAYLQGPRPVHPHARGDNSIPAAAVAAMAGSPPRAWGQLLSFFLELLGNRFTPTRVGTTEQPSTWHLKGPVHPHARGDNCDEKSIRSWHFGSPPRAWGQHEINDLSRFTIRFTPTRVGTTILDRVASLPLAVHPHARGDNSIPAAAVAAMAGSPPRAWGQLLSFFLELLGNRFTPTRVGTTEQPSTWHLKGPVHPHARGDNCDEKSIRSWHFGSPPRAWGQLHSQWIYSTQFRFTPTRVGTTNSMVSLILGLTVHPHARGDNGNAARGSQGQQRGSPPRAWGQLYILDRPSSRAGFTPTRVGTTLKNPSNYGMRTRKSPSKSSMDRAVFPQL